MIYVYLLRSVLCRSLVYFLAVTTTHFSGLTKLYLIVRVAQKDREVLWSAYKIKQTFFLAMEMTIKIASNLWHTEIERWRTRKW